ncbi:MAG: ThiF family adenylyltransferase, partial [Patescibacteria group bacterium]|nr:ThiF family adenylyltransferase [Patescibacteria group bacterium]
MSHKLIDLNEDLRKLRDEGYNVDIYGGYLIVRDVPYVNDKRELRRDGVLATPLNLNGDILNPPSDHTIKFAGDYPCGSDGKPIEGIRQGSEALSITPRLTTQHSFSAKPPAGNYKNYYEKIRTYVAILSGPASTMDPQTTAKTFRVVEPEDDGSPFQYIDTASAQAEISAITQKLAADKIAIVGLGGTGSYVLDLLAKTPVKEIHIFDGDKFSSHNAFRAPGAASKDDLHKQPLKVEYFKKIYVRMHKGIKEHPAHIDANNIDQLRDMACVFVCIDAGPEKKLIIDKLTEFGALFIDVGMGLYVNNEKIGGILQVVTSTPDNREKARARISFGGRDENNEYDKNIQIADLNALNAVLAVIR